MMNTNLPDRADLTPLLAPTARAALPPAASPAALTLSAALANDVYHAALEPWLAAGWRDLTYQVDDSLTAVPRERPEGRLQQLRSRLSSSRTFSTLLGSLRRKDRAEACKALVMAHPIPDGRHLIAVSFMGTGKQMSDWVGNLRMEPEDGLHRGFLQLTEQFEANADRILLPETAKALGLPRLSFAEVLRECTLPHSRFRIWVTGHSRGAAILQIWCLRRLAEGIRPGHLIGYGFASPTVALAARVRDPGAFPVCNLINSDDLVPRIGAEVHLGLVLTYPADARLRTICYRLPEDTTPAERQALRGLLTGLTSTRTGLIAGAGLIDACKRLSPEDLFAFLREVPDVLRPLLFVTGLADGAVDSLLARLETRIAALYAELFGEAIPPAALAQWSRDCYALMQQMGSRRFFSLLSAWVMSAHTCRPDDGAYAWIAAHGADSLLPACWTGRREPRLHRLDVQPILPRVNKPIARPPRRMTRTGTHLPRRRAESRPR